MTPSVAPTLFDIPAPNLILLSVDRNYEMKREMSGSVIAHNVDVNYAWKRR